MSPLTNYGSCFFGILDNHRTSGTALACIKSGEVNGASPSISKGTDCHSLRLQKLEGTGNIQETLASAADHRHMSTTKFSEVSRDVHGVLASTMDTSQSSCPEYFDASFCSKKHGSRYCRSAIELTSSNSLGLELSPWFDQGGKYIR